MHHRGDRFGLKDFYTLLETRDISSAHSSVDFLFDEIFESPPSIKFEGIEIGYSRAGRPITGFRLGFGTTRISLIGGCHADEPVGPEFLRRFVSFLSRQSSDSPFIGRYTWWIVPHLNPDGEIANSQWFDSQDEQADPGKYLAKVKREAPGDDLEFGFPIADRARPEASAVYRWWLTDKKPFSLHISFHGMGFSGGPWFLLSPFRDIASLGKVMNFCSSDVEHLGYQLHDVERNGEKGFKRLARGFCTHPTSDAMRDHFMSLGQVEVAQQFKPSSMEAARSLGGDPLTLVSEIPLFTLPNVGKQIFPTDPEADRWNQIIAGWKKMVEHEVDYRMVGDEMLMTGIRPMSYREQMRLQFGLLFSGLMTLNSP